uniref:DUF1189 domain-containing protein n=1 Tax=candidate division WWE3 bacterium TaxID=2053526 RepID=A0A7C4TL64_UNCKA
MKRLASQIKTFFHVFTKSMGSLDYYGELLETPFKFSAKYFFTLLFLAATAVTSKEAVNIFRELEPNIKSTLKNTISLYPNDLVIDIKDGEATFSTQSPVLIKNPAYNSEDKEEIPENLILLDAEGKITDLKDKNALMVLNRKNLLIQEQNSVGTYPLTNVTDTKIDKTMLQGGLESIKPFIKVIPYILTLILLTAMFGYYVFSKGFYLVTVSCVLWGFAILANERVKFSKLYQFAVHAMTLPIILEVVIGFASDNPHLSILPSVLNIAIGVGGLFAATRKKIEE